MKKPILSEVEKELSRTNDGMNFHQVTCDICPTTKTGCEVWQKLVITWNFLYLGQIYAQINS